MIARHLRRTPGIGVEDGAAFFAGRGERTGPMWTALRDALERWAEVHPDDVDAVADGAVVTFGALERWMTRPAAVPGASAGTAASR